MSFPTRKMHLEIQKLFGRLCTDTDLSAQSILNLYTKRWPIENFFRTAKDNLLWINPRCFLLLSHHIVSLLPVLCWEVVFCAHFWMAIDIGRISSNASLHGMFANAARLKYRLLCWGWGNFWHLLNLLIYSLFYFLHLPYIPQWCYNMSVFVPRRTEICCPSIGL